MKPQNIKNRGYRFDRAVCIFKKHGGILRTAQALRAGIHPGTFYAMRDSGALEAISRGVYRLANGPPLAPGDNKIPPMSGALSMVPLLRFL